MIGTALYKLVVGLVRPYTLLFLLQALALVHLWWRWRESRRRLGLVLIPFAGLWALSLPLLSYLALGTLEWRYPPTEGRPGDPGVEAIVVLSGETRPLDAARTRFALGYHTLYRCLHAAEIYRQGPPLPVLVTGGKVDPRAPGPPCASLMSEFLRSQGVAETDLIVERRSRSTYENAVQSARELRRRGIRRVILVTEATHMLRAQACFRKQGIAVVPSACHHRALGLEPSLFLVLPNPNAAATNLEVAHEWMGLVYYGCRGYL